MIIGVFIAGLILIMPIFINVYFCFDVDIKRLYFGIYVFKKIKVVSGYFKERNRGGFYLHVSNTKAIIIDKTIIKKLSGGPNYLKNFEIFNVNVITDLSVNKTLQVYSTLFLNHFFNVVSKIINNSNLTLKPTSNLCLILDNSNVFNVKVEILLTFNLVCILKSLIANAKNVGVKYVKQKI